MRYVKRNFRSPESPAQGTRGHRENQRYCSRRCANKLALVKYAEKAKKKKDAMRNEAGQ